ncbi:MAG: rhodanese-like domain-containing protein [Anaerolineae bacterium]
MKKAADMVKEANEIIDVISAEEAIAMKDQDDVTFIDIREMGELHKNGKIPGSHRVPRGMLEFYVDPTSPAYKVELFPEGNKYYFY